MNYSGTQEIHAGNKTLFVYSVDKEEELLTMNFDGLDEFFKKLDKKGGRKSFGNAFIMFDGYNDVVDELHEIEEVRKFVKVLFDKHPHLLYYINFEMEGHHVLLASLLDFYSVGVGVKMTPIELTEKYGPLLEGAPKNNMHLRMPNELLVKLKESTIEHGEKMKRKSLGEKLAHRLDKMFSD